VIGVQGSVGYTPSFFKHSLYRGYNYADAQMKIGYDMGRLMPFLTIGGGVARPNGRMLDGYSGTTNSMNDLFNSTANLRGFGMAGAGFAYKLTPNTTVELAVQAYRGNGFIGP
jgi:outer membrane immunogenic protein